MATGAGVLEDVEQDAQPAAGDVVQFGAVDDHVFVGGLEHWLEASLGLCAGSVVEGSPSPRPPMGGEQLVLRGHWAYILPSPLGVRI